MGSKSRIDCIDARPERAFLPKRVPKPEPVTLAEKASGRRFDEWSATLSREKMEIPQQSDFELISS
jgi:hypothetical protein